MQTLEAKESVMEDFIFAVVVIAIIVGVTTTNIVDRVYENKEKMANCEVKK